MQKKLLSIIVPCYNEKKSLEPFYTQLIFALKKIEMDYEIIFVNDGSTDNTLEQMLSLKQSNNNIKILVLSRNFGKEAALSAGLDYAKGDAVVPIDVDLQDPPCLIIDFIRYWQQGFKVVLGKRVDRESDSCAKRVSAELFYKLHNKISKIKIPENVGDFRLMDKEVVQSIRKLPENQRFMKGIFAWVGYDTKIVEYKREERVLGISRFSPWKLWNFALDGITSFSTAPLRIWLYIGSLIALISFMYGCFIVLKTLILGVELPGYASLVTIILFLGGVQLIGIGVLGEYIGRIYFEAKRRPAYIIEKIYE